MCGQILKTFYTNFENRVTECGNFPRKIDEKKRLGNFGIRKTNLSDFIYGLNRNRVELPKKNQINAVNNPRLRTFFPYFRVPSSTSAKSRIFLSISKKGKLRDLYVYVGKATSLKKTFRQGICRYKEKVEGKVRRCREIGIRKREGYERGFWKEKCREIGTRKKWRAREVLVGKEMQRDW